MLDSLRHTPTLVMPTRQQWYILFMLTLTSLGGMLYGFDVGIISGAILFMQRDIALSATQLSMIVAAVLGGGSIATLVSGWLADRYGRRMLLIASTLVFLLGVLVLTHAQAFLMLLTGRVI